MRHGAKVVPALSSNLEQMNQTLSNHGAPSSLASPERAAAITRVFGTLCLAVVSLVVIEVILFRTGTAQSLAARLAGVNWLFVLGAFMLAGWMARGLAHRVGSPAAQWAGLALYIGAQALILAPMLVWSENSVPGVINDAARLTVAATIGLMAVAWYSRHDFTFSRPFLMWSGWIALAAIVFSLLTGFRLGIWFSAGMILLAGAGILNDTSKLRRRRISGRETATALELFASMAMLFWYVLRLSRQLQR